MKAEKQHQELQSRTIQSKKGSNERFSFVDNRPLQLQIGHLIQMASKFTGVESAVHIHHVGSRSQAHLKYGKDIGSRHDFHTNNRRSVEGAINYLKRQGWQERSGYVDCLKYLIGICREFKELELLRVR